MPNIEIHGQTIEEEGGFEDLAVLKDKIFNLLFAKPYQGDVVVTVCLDSVYDYLGKPQPFLRVVSTPSNHLEEIIELLKTLDMDIEVMMLTAFHPKAQDKQ